MPGYVHVKKRLTDLSIRFPAEQIYCGQDFFPRKPVENLSDFIPKWQKGNILRLDELAMSAPDDQLPPEVELVLDADDSYQLRVYAVRSPDKVITKKNADAGLDYDVERTMHVRQRLDTRLEYLRIKQTVRSTALNTNNTTLITAQQWDNPTSAQSTPVATGRNIVTNMKLLNGGNPPNVVRMSDFTKTAIITHDEFKDFVKYNVLDRGAPIGDEDLIALVWGLKPGSVKVSAATYNAKAAGLTPVYKQFMGADVAFAYVTPPGLRTYGFGTEFRFSGYNTDPHAIITVPQFQRGAIPGEDIRGISLNDPHIYNVDSGYLIVNAINPNGSAYGSWLN